MDPALLRERELFKKRALTTPTVEKKKNEPKSETVKDDKKKAKSNVNSAPKLDINTYKTASGSSQYRFGVLLKIVKHMKTRHQEGDTHPLSLEDILDETNQLDVGAKVKQWLASEALQNNPKIEVTPDGRYIFKAMYKLKDRKSLLKLLKQQDLKGLGGVMLEDIQESLPHCEKALKTLQNQNEIIFITRPIDKKKVLFYNDRTAQLPIDEEFQKLWRSVGVDVVDDAKIDEYLEKQGIRSMQDHGIKKQIAPKRKKANQRKRQFKKPRDNEHLADVLETYEDNTLTQKNTVSNRVRRIVGGIEADVAPYDEPVVYANYGEKTATIRGLLDEPHYSFRGIRYGESPVGIHRFQRPRKYILEGDYNATEYPPPCIQPVPKSDKIIGKEDCLFLNVFTPMLPEGDEGLPVILWIHGGGFRYGSASQYGPKHLMKKKVVLVTIQYRLGTLGFLSAGSSDFPGNAGLFDIALATEWTKHYIAFFGGNAKKISVMGQGTGGSCALLLGLSKLSKGIPSSVVAMSGTAISNWAIDKTPGETAKEVAAYQGCPTNHTVKMIKCMQTLDAEAIVKGDNYIESTRLKDRGFLSGLSGLLSPSPATEGDNDGRSLPAMIQREPLDDMSTGRKPNIPLLTGITKDETKRAVNDQFKKEIVANLKTIPNFLNKVLIKNLQSLSGLTTSVTNQNNVFWNILDPLNFRPYMQSTSNSIVDNLSKVSEATGDALFNLPAFMSADLWSKNNTPVFLYRFDHVGKAPKGNAFLNGLPLVSSNIATGEKDTVSHGDDLAYLFEPLDLDGSPLKEPQIHDEQDEGVRDLFTQTIVDFIGNGSIRLNNQLVPKFTSNANNFIEISSQPKISNKFRYCEMALWAGLGDRLKDVSCQVQDGFLGVVGAPLSPLKNATSQVGTELLKKPTGNLINLFG
ncbi:hypothetical protein Trydic_g2270 [Trypoxylus dichotomus]